MRFARMQRDTIWQVCALSYVVVGIVILSAGNGADAKLDMCLHGVNHPGGDLPNMPIKIAAVDPTLCADKCKQTDGCNAYVYHWPNCSDHGEVCSFENGCCFLKHNVTDETQSVCTCSQVFQPEPEPRPTSNPPVHAKNVLYILVDDLRPQLPDPAYGQNMVHAPNIARLASDSLVFNRAYCQQAVCSPSRMSFLTGRRPDNTKVYNFINHIRQRDCGITTPGVEIRGSAYKTLDVTDHQGGAGQCCTSCTLDDPCQAWTYDSDKALCKLFKTSEMLASKDSLISGLSGGIGNSNWTTMPQHFFLSGYLTLGTGKVFHTEEGGIGPAPWVGQGMPPMQDPPSWSPGLSMADVNSVAPMVGCQMGNSTNCPVNATMEGNVPKGTAPFCDKVIGDDAINKLQLASEHLNATGRPFFLSVGFRKPHLAFRFPKPFLQFYPDMSHIALAKQKTLDPSAPPVAHRSGTIQNNPYEPIPDELAQQYRLYYYACISWMDYQVGRVVDELKTLGLYDNTLIVFHSDHGWNLGEHGQWEKMTNWELGTRVPLIIRDPWIPSSHGKRSDALVELVDVFPTMCDLANVPCPKGERLDGVSLRPLLEDPSNTTFKPYALSQYPRCPQNMGNVSDYWDDNVCLFKDRRIIPIMGYSIRTDEWRYTEWVRFNGSSLMPLWDQQVAVELYTHQGDDERDYDAFENKNQAESEPSTVKQLSQMLHEAFAKARHDYNG